MSCVGRLLGTGSSRGRGGLCDVRTASPLRVQQREVSGSAGGAAEQSSSSARPRRSKRVNYADADAVYASEVSPTEVKGAERGWRWWWLPRAAAPHPTVSPPSPSSASFLASTWLHVKSPSTQNAQNGKVSRRQRCGDLRRSLAFSPTWVRQQWLTMLLSLLHTPVLSVVTVGMLKATAYAAYVKGSVVLFTRCRVGPSLGSTRSTAADAVEEGVTSGPSLHGMQVVSHSGVEAGPHPSPATLGTVSPPLLSWSNTELLQGHALSCLYIGQSPIHSRGLFTSCALSRGTRIIAEPRRSLLAAPHFITLLADTHTRLPDTWHYTQPGGSVVELVTQAQPHHLLNHSCDANVCSGLSRPFWVAAALADVLRQGSPLHCRDGGIGDDDGGHNRAGGAFSDAGGKRPPPRAAQDFFDERSARYRGVDTVVHRPSSSAKAAAARSASVPWAERLTRWPHFDDPNSFFLLRDVAAGEELTLDYSARMAPLYSGDLVDAAQARSWLLCRCGQPNCRHFVYRPAPEVNAVLQTLRRTRRRWRGRASSPRSPPLEAAEGPASAGSRVSALAETPPLPDSQHPLYTMATLMAHGFDDELVLLAYGASSADVVAYLYGQIPPLLRAQTCLLPPSLRSSLPGGVDTAQPQRGIEVEVRTVSKRELLTNYRYVFRHLNEAVPQ